MSSNEQSPAPFLPPQLRAFAPYFLLTLALFAAYGNIFDNEFLFDDDLIIKGNTYLRDWDHIWDILTGSTTSGVHIVGGFYRPVQVFLYLFAYQLGDGGTFWFHLLNLSLHIVNTCLVFKLGTKLGFRTEGAFFAALVWCLHPLHVEAVTYMSATADTLNALFCLWPLVILLPDFSMRKIWAVLPLFLLGILSKETTVILPLLIVVCMFYASPRRCELRQYLRTWPMWVIGIVFMYWRLHAEGFDGPQTYARFYASPSFSSLKLYAEHPLYRVNTFLATLPDYARLLVWPTHLHMERSFPVHSTPLAWPVITGFFMLASACAFIVYSFKTGRFKEIGWGLLWFGAAHAPNTGLLAPMNALFLEHWMYLPSIGLFLCLGQTFAEAAARKPRIAHALCAAAIMAGMALAIKTYNQNEIWRNPDLFYNNIFTNRENSARARNNLALYYSQKGRTNEAIEQYNKAIEASDVYAETHYNLALVYLGASRNKDSIDKAVKHLKRSLEIQPNFYRSYKALGDIHARLLNDKATAETYFAKAKAIIGDADE